MNEHAIESGYDCWLNYKFIKEDLIRKAYLKRCSQLIVIGKSAMMESARGELELALTSMLGQSPKSSDDIRENHSALVVGTFSGSPELAVLAKEYDIDEPSEEGYVIHTSEDGRLFLAASTDKGALYAAFHFIRLLQTGVSIDKLRIHEAPRNDLRMINHWDNMDGSIERGYAGKSIFYRNNKIETDLKRIRDYARLLASGGINAITINNVNVHRQ